MSRLSRTALTLGAVYGALQLLGRTAGSTAVERLAPLPGDDVVEHPTVVTNHAITIDAPPSAVWPWLTQMGWHRGGWYTPRWVDVVLFPPNHPSAETLEPEWVRDLEVGDVIPDGPPGTAWFDVAEVRAPHVLVLHSTTHMPEEWREEYGAAISWTWAFVLTDAPGGGTRLHLRVRGRTEPWWVTAAYVAVLVPADLVMALGMLRGVKRRVERAASSSQ